MLSKIFGFIGSIGFIILIILVIITAVREPETSLEYGKTVFFVGKDTYSTLKENYSDFVNETLEEIETEDL